MSTYEEAYNLIENPYRTRVLRTAERNALIEWSVEHLPTYRGSIYAIKSESLGGGIWKCWAEKETRR